MGARSEADRSLADRVEAAIVQRGKGLEGGKLLFQCFNASCPSIANGRGYPQWDYTARRWTCPSCGLSGGWKDAEIAMGKIAGAKAEGERKADTSPAQASTNGHKTIAGATESDGTGNQTPSQATRLVASTVKDGVELFHTPDREAFATVPVDAHRETWPLRTRAFRQWLAGNFYRSEGKAVGSQALQDAITALEGKAQYEGLEQPVFTRLAQHDSAIYLDLCNTVWEAVEVTPHGWRIVAAPPVRFRRARTMLPLPHPVAGGSIAALRPFVNVVDDADWALALAWLVAALRPSGPYPLLALHGEQGSAKSTTARVLRGLVDPNAAPLRAEPGDDRDLMIGATNSWVVAFDNLSHLPGWLSDALCRLSTGGGFATRELYSDLEETVFNAQRPVLVNGIEELATRGDLLDRSVTLYLPRISDDKRRDEQTFWAEFETARPRILGALLDTVVRAARDVGAVHLEQKPRMADFAVWAVAAEPALGLPKGAFLAAYSGNRGAMNDLALEGSAVADAVSTIARGGGFEGTAKELLGRMDALADEQAKRWKDWPRTAKKLRGALRRMAPNLRRVGVVVEFDQTAGSNSKRIVRVRTVAPESDATDACDATNTEPPRELTHAETNGAPPTSCASVGVTCVTSPPNHSKDDHDGGASGATAPAGAPARRYAEEY